LLGRGEAVEKQHRLVATEEDAGSPGNRFQTKVVAPATTPTPGAPEPDL